MRDPQRWRPHRSSEVPLGHDIARCRFAVQVAEASEVRTVIDKLPAAKRFLFALYHCDYRQYFPAFLEVVALLEADLYLADHVRFFMREARVVAYLQYLTSYKSVTIAAMARAFGVSEAFIDSEVRAVLLRSPPLLLGSDTGHSGRLRHAVVM
jgi:hypothetical protein